MSQQLAWRILFEVEEVNEVKDRGRGESGPARRLVSPLPPFPPVLPYFVSSGRGDFCRYAATPITALISDAAAPMRNVAAIPACKLKCCGSMPTAASPVSTPPAAPVIAAATIPLSQI